MAFYRKLQMKTSKNKKWYPQAVLVDKPISTDELSEEIATASTVAPADVAATLKSLSGIMGKYMAQGRSVRLDGIGTFHFTINAEGNGVDTPEEVSARQIKGIRVRFTPETAYRIGGVTGRVATRALSDVRVNWVDIDTLASPVSYTDAPDEEPQQPEAGGDNGDDNGGGLEM